MFDLWLTRRETFVLSKIRSASTSGVGVWTERSTTIILQERILDVALGQLIDPAGIVMAVGKISGETI